MRFYEAEGTPLPSVTTILSATKDMTGLEKWRERIGDEEADRIVKESVEIGTQIHNNLENYVLNKTKPTGKVIEQMLTNVIIRKGLVSVNEVWGVEVALYCKGLYAGTTDLVGMHNGIPAIMDFKNSRKPKKEEYVVDYSHQLAAYAIAHNEMFGTNINKGVVMMVSRNGEYQEFLYEGKKYQKAVDGWLSRLEEYYQKN